MEMAETIRTAWVAVEESGIPEPMRELAFRETLRVLLASAKSATQDGEVVATGGGSLPSEEPRGKSSSSIDEATVLSAIADRTEVPIEKLERVFHLDDGVVKVLIRTSALGRTNADKTRNVAQIITVARKLGLGSADTPFSIIRDECDRLHILDTANFASKHLPNIEGFSVKGDGRNRRLEARSIALDAFPALIDKVLGES
jgi:hypothetical protein